MSKPILVLDNLHASVEGTEILKGVSLELPQGEVHATVSYTHLTLPTN